MKQLFTLLLLSASVCWLPAQQLYQHPMLSFLGTDLNRMTSLTSGALGYQGLGTNRFQDTHNFLNNRHISLHWHPFYPQPNGFGCFMMPSGYSGAFLSQGPGQTDLGGGYGWNHQNDIHQSFGVQSRWQNQWADNNNDGFNDYQKGRHYLLHHRIGIWTDEWRVALYSTYLNANRHQGQEGYDLATNAGGDSIYGYGTDTRQWRSFLRADKRFRHGGEITLVANLQAHREEGYYGQREIRAQEIRQEIGGHYSYRKPNFRSAAAFLISTQDLGQSWADWQDHRNWTNAQLGIHHEHFLRGDLLVKAQAQVDYHSMTDLQLLPSLRLDYLGIKGLRLGVMAGRDYRLARILEEQEGLLLSQRQWQLDDYAPDRLWYTGLSAQSDIYEMGSVKQQLKVTYRAHHFTQLHLIDPSLEGLVSDELLQEDIPTQHMLIANLQTNIYRWRWTSTYRYRDIPLLYQNGTQQQFMESKHSTFNSLSYMRRLDNAIRQQWDVRLYHLWRSPQELINGEQSPHLHDLRIHLESGRSLRGHWEHRVFVFAGVENLLNQRQDDLFQNADTPFGLGFDGSSAWGNAIGRRFYVGVRWQP